LKYPLDDVSESAENLPQEQALTIATVTLTIIAVLLEIHHTTSQIQHDLFDFTDYDADDFPACGILVSGK
jgi:hypothetical protein